MFYSPPLPKFKPSWKARKVKALPIESVVKEGSPVMVWRANNACSGLGFLLADQECPHCHGIGWHLSPCPTQPSH